MRRVVVTGLGIVSSIGSDKNAVLTALQSGHSGIEFCPEYQELGLRSQVHGPLRIAPQEHIKRKLLRFMGDAAAFSYIAMEQAIEDAALGKDAISHPRTGLIVGSGGGSPANQVLASDLLRERGIRKVGPYMVPRTMTSTTSACLAVPYQIRGINYSMGSACSTSAHCIGNAMEQIQWDKQDIVFAGGGEEVHWTMTLLFDGMGALSSKFNEQASTASRPYDVERDGFVISGGGGMLVLEELEHAQQRGAHIYAEVVGYGATSDGDDMVQPSGEGAVRCMQSARGELDVPIDYINAHGTSTPVGDIRELEAIGEVFGPHMPPISSTKSLTGHALGAAGVNEAIYALLMMQYGFITATANVERLDTGANGYPLVLEQRDHVDLNTVMSNSFGFGGTNASLIFQRYAG